MINVAQVRLIDDKGENVGVKTIGEAMRMAAMAAGLFAVGVVSGWMVRGVVTVPTQTVSLPRQAAIAHVVYAPEVRHPVEEIGRAHV